MTIADKTTEQLQKELAQQKEALKAARRLSAVRAAHDNLLEFLRLTMPDPEDPDDALRSMYEITPQAQLLAQIMEKVERRELQRVAVSIGPQTGKSQLISRASPAWFTGRNPRINMILGSYNQDFANEFGDDVRNIINSNAYKQVFPKYRLRGGGKAKDLLINIDNGKMAFVGVGGSGTGKPADVFIVDDPIRNDDDAQSGVYRSRMWQWFTRVVNTRIHNDSAVVVVHTRWHEDDLIGRLCDPDHPERNTTYAGIAEEWSYFNIPAVVEDPALAKALGLTLEVSDDPLVVSQFGDKPIASIWPNRFSLNFLARQKRMDRRGFGALRMGQPAPEDGDYFRAADIVEYHSIDQLPKSLRWYGASDHAVSEKQKADWTVIGCAGVDENDDIWIPPDVFWEQVETDETVDEFIRQFKRHRPLLWWMESELISKSFGPFLRKRMQEEKTYLTIDPVVPSKDKKTRARSIQGRMRMGKVHFPAFAPWYVKARAQLLKFPYATNDDFVDWISHVGMGLDKEVPASKVEKQEEKVVAVGSIQWILAQTKRKERIEKAKRAAAGW